MRNAWVHTTYQAYTLIWRRGIAISGKKKKNFERVFFHYSLQLLLRVLFYLLKYTETICIFHNFSFLHV
jgi:hypothetical protein